MKLINPTSDRQVDRLTKELCSMAGKLKHLGSYTDEQIASAFLSTSMVAGIGMGPDLEKKMGRIFDRLAAVFEAESYAVQNRN